MRRGKLHLTLIDAILVTVVAAIVTAVAVPVLEATSREAKHTTALESLRGLRSQIEIYKAEHGGRTPVLHEGTLPQLIRATNAQGTMGTRGGRFPFGPYLHNGVPVNPYTGRSIVTETKEFPPKASSGNGGWLYHPPSGQIALDHEDYLDL